MSGKPQNPEKPYNKLTVGIAPDSWGAWLPESDKQVNWRTFLDKVAEAGCEVIETGPSDFPSIDPEVLQAECTKRGIHTAVGIQLDILHRPEAQERAERKMRTNVSVLKTIDTHHLVYLPPMLHDLQAGGWIEDPNLSGINWRLLVGNANHLGKLLKEGYDTTVMIHPRGDPHIGNHEQIDRLFAEIDFEYASFCPDTGHLEYGEVDTVGPARSYPGHIGLVHIEQMDPEAVQWIRRENLSSGEVAPLGVCIAPDTGRLKVGAVTDALVAFDKEFYIIAEQDLYPYAPGAPPPLAIETCRVLTNNHLGIH